MTTVQKQQMKTISKINSRKKGVSFLLSSGVWPTTRHQVLHPLFVSSVWFNWNDLSHWPAGRSWTYSSFFSLMKKKKNSRVSPAVVSDGAGSVWVSFFWLRLIFLFFSSEGSEFRYSIAIKWVQPVANEKSVNAPRRSSHQEAAQSRHIKQFNGPASLNKSVFA